MGFGDVVDWVSLITGPLGIVLSILGFLIAILQIRRVRKASEAAATATERTTRALVHNQVLFLIPELSRLAVDIHQTVNKPDEVRFLELTEHWRTSGIRVRGLLRARGAVDDRVLAALTRSFTLATSAKEKVRASGNLHEDAKAFTRAVDRAIEELGDVGGERMLGHVEGGSQ